MGFRIPLRGRNQRHARPHSPLFRQMKSEALFTSLILIVAVCFTSTVFTAISYGGTCSQLTGFPGLLQRAGFVAEGPCATKRGGAVCQNGADCTTSNRKRGKCKNIAARGPANCACVEITVSRGLR
jgi:hypothetical protein